MEENKEYFSLNTEGTLAERFRLVASHHSDKKSWYICVATAGIDG